MTVLNLGVIPPVAFVLRVCLVHVNSVASLSALHARKAVQRRTTTTRVSARIVHFNICLYKRTP